MRLGFLATLLAATSASAAPDPIQLAAKTHGSVLDLTFSNTTDRPLKIATRIAAGEANYDWLTVELAPRSGSDPAATKRRFGFVTARLASAQIVSEIAARGTFTESIDLVPWALRDGAPLAPGSYDLTASWDASHETVRFAGRATTTLTIAAPVYYPKAGCPTSSAGTIQLFARSRGGTNVELGLHNAGTSVVCVQKPMSSCIASDASLKLTFDPGTSKARSLGLGDMAICDKTSIAPIILLAPGATAWDPYDLKWVAQSIARGGHHVELTYSQSRNAAIWRGTLTAAIDIAAP